MDITPPTISLAVTPDSGITDETNFQFDPIGSNDNLSPSQELQIRFDWNNDGSFDVNWSQLSIINYQFSVGGGDKTINMQLTDGAWQVDTTVTIFVNTRPQAYFTATMDNDNNKLYHFDASESSDYEDGTNLEYRWDFNGDSNWETGWLTQDTVSYEYPENPAYYTVKLEVRDHNSLTNDKTIQVIVTHYVTDIDGNVYQIVKIGNQWWMAENLKVTHYRNGDILHNIFSSSMWKGLSNGAYCFYNNDNSNGLLYNWYAVNNSRNIAPQGWHIPTDEEWKQLEMYLGMSQSDADNTEWRGTDEGSKLKSSSEWNNNGNGTNESGFTALPGGYRNYAGEFYVVGDYGYWWSSTEFGSSAWSRILYYSNSAVRRANNDKRSGFSVRCIMD